MGEEGAAQSGSARLGDSDGIDVDDGGGTRRTQPATRRELPPPPRASSGSVNPSKGDASPLYADARDSTLLAVAARTTGTSAYDL